MCLDVRISTIHPTLNVMRSGLVRTFCRRLSDIQLEHTPHSKFVPAHSSVNEADLHTLEQFIVSSERLFVLTGAGVSTESGIKDYRSEGVGLYATTSQKPTTYANFLRSSRIRQRYWARNTTAWPIFSSFRPNTSHKFLATLEHQGKLKWLVTQNVDNLHHIAGSRQLTELHGTMFSVGCLGCKSFYPRADIQEQIYEDNPQWSAQPEGFAPDADVFVAEDLVKMFKTPLCRRCGGILKPDVVFFGDSVPKSRVQVVNDKLEECDACLVAGSSLETYSSFRHVRRCKELGIPLLLINIGRTRADTLTNGKIVGRCGEAFKWLQDKL